MSKKSCKAAESIEDALLRMARVNGNFFFYHLFLTFYRFPCSICIYYM